MNVCSECLIPNPPQNRTAREGFRLVARTMVSKYQSVDLPAGGARVAGPFQSEKTIPQRSDAGLLVVGGRCLRRLRNLLH
jgi:hypothetical protein